MLYPANVPVNRHPVGCLFVKGLFIFFRAAVAEKIPAAVNESIHRVCFAFCIRLAVRAFHINKLVTTFQRVSLPCKLHPFWLRELYRQLIFRNRHSPAFAAINFGYWRSPVSLARNKPVAELVGCCILCTALFYKKICCGFSGLYTTHPIKFTGIYHYTFFNKCFPHFFCF